MSRYSHKFKLEIVQYYLEKHIGVAEIARQFKIPSESVIRRWIRKYEEHGATGLIRNLNFQIDSDKWKKTIKYDKIICILSATVAQLVEQQIRNL